MEACELPHSSGPNERVLTGTTGTDPEDARRCEQEGFAHDAVRDAVLVTRLVCSRRREWTLGEPLRRFLVRAWLTRHECVAHGRRGGGRESCGQDWSPVVHVHGSDSFHRVSGRSERTQRTEMVSALLVGLRYVLTIAQY